MTQAVADLANELLVELTGDADFSVPKIDLTDPKFNIPYDPDSDLYKSVKHLVNADITTQEINGTGTFDVIMGGAAAQLAAEYDSERITGAEYTKAYIGTMGAALQNAVAFLTTKDQVFWQAQTAQYEAIKARLDAENAKLALAASIYDMYNRKAQYALTKEQLATAKLEFDANSFNVEQMLPLQATSQQIRNTSDQYVYDKQMPLQTSMLTLQNAGQETSNASSAYSLANILPKQATGLDLENQASTVNVQQILPKQAAALDLQNNTAKYNLETYLPTQTAIATDQDTLLKTQNTNAGIEGSIQKYNLTDVLPAQVALTKDQDVGVTIQNDTARYSLANVVPSQWALLKEQVESQIAQTKGTRSDGTPLSGLMGAQIALYDQQEVSYKRDAESKGLKLMLDPWAVAKSADEAVETPTSINNNAINTAATKYLGNLGLI